MLLEYNRNPPKVSELATLKREASALNASIDSARICCEITKKIRLTDDL
jgi:hypothetical protein